jgi:hypothetical protein
MAKRELIAVILAAALGLVCEAALARRGVPSGPVRAAGDGSVATFAGNAQHTAVFLPPAQDLNAIHWSAPIDLHSGSLAHYGAPLITSANTVLVPVKTATDGFQIASFDGTGGVGKYTLTTDYALPPHNWIPTYQPVLASGASGLRLYYAGAGGTVSYIDNPDSAAHGAPVQLVFYTNSAEYQANAAAFNASVFINTPLTADSGGNVFFGFRVVGTAPAPLSTTQSGFARIGANGDGAYVLAGTAANDANITRDSHNSAPALSNDESTLYVVVKSDISAYCYLLGLDATSLATKFRRFLKDPRDGGANNAVVSDDGTAAPMVAPDGDVYFGVLANPDNGSRGFLLRFSSDLAVAKTPGGFGWDYTAAIVPREMVPSYTGSSPYLIFSKYNNYASFASGGDGVNRIALLDPDATEVDPHPSSNGLVVMREFLTVTGPTPDAGNPSFPDAVREWCINTAAVNPATNSIFSPNEDGHIYRWNLATNSLSQEVALTEGVGEPYVPTVIGPGGIVYTLNGGTLFALGALDGVGITLSSSSPDVRDVVAGQSLTFAAAVANTGVSGNTPTGTVTFQDTLYFINGSGTLASTTIVLAADVPLDGSGHAAVTTAALAPGNHFVDAIYSGDANFGPGRAGLVQKIHDEASSTTLASSRNPAQVGLAVTFTATVAAAPPAQEIPSGMATFREGATDLAQVPLNGSGAASFSTAALTVGSHTITAVFSSDTRFAASSGEIVQQIEVAPPGSSFFTVAACRVADTREAPGPSGGPALTANSVRAFPVSGLCAIPSSATAVVVNLAAILPANDGDLRVYPSGGSAPLASALNFRAGSVRASHAIVPLGAGGQISVQCDMPSGSTHLIIDTYGYFQ